MEEAKRKQQQYSKGEQGRWKKEEKASGTPNPQFWQHFKFMNNFDPETLMRDKKKLLNVVTLMFLGLVTLKILGGGRRGQD